MALKTFVVLVYLHMPPKMPQKTECPKTLSALRKISKLDQYYYFTFVQNNKVLKMLKMLKILKCDKFVKTKMHLKEGTKIEERLFRFDSRLLVAEKKAAYTPFKELLRSNNNKNIFGKVLEKFVVYFFQWIYRDIILTSLYTINI